MGCLTNTLNYLSPSRLDSTQCFVNTLTCATDKGAVWKIIFREFRAAFWLAPWLNYRSQCYNLRTKKKVPLYSSALSHFKVTWPRSGDYQNQQDKQWYFMFTGQFSCFLYLNQEFLGCAAIHGGWETEVWVSLLRLLPLWYRLGWMDGLIGILSVPH